jgi:Cytochrome oxidase complex assembly protein 1
MHLVRTFTMAYFHREKRTSPVLPAKRSWPFPFSGRKGKGTIYVIATKSAGEWQYSKLIVKTNDGETIDLNQNTGPNGSETNDEPDDNET